MAFVSYILLAALHTWLRNRWDPSSTWQWQVQITVAFVRLAKWIRIAKRRESRCFHTAVHCSLCSYPSRDAGTVVIVFIWRRFSESHCWARRVSVKVQTGILGELDALARCHSKIQEFLAVVNAGVNHGPLMSVLQDCSGYRKRRIQFTQQLGRCSSTHFNLYCFSLCGKKYGCGCRSYSLAY